MLDAYIIERIKRERAERAQRDGGFVPLHIEPNRPQPERRERDERDEKNEDHGSVIVDFHV